MSQVLKSVKKYKHIITNVIPQIIKKEVRMFRSFSITLLIVFLLSSNAFAGFSSYDRPYSSDSVIAPIQIKDKGMYNLVVAIQFLNEPYEQKVYESDEYENFLRRLKMIILRYLTDVNMGLQTEGMMMGSLWRNCGMSMGSSR